MTASLLKETLVAFEVTLHQPDVRADRHRLDRLLHPEFIEFGRSGRVWSREEILAELPTDSEPPAIHAEGYVLQSLGNDVALLTYRSSHRSVDGHSHRHTLRASLWQRDEHGWRARFHQGTPTESVVPR